ncbi:lysine biosynthesis protein LysX [Micromonospora sp. KC723]|uniref:lysine biosynthesis protein LysX n=1 Tax=Micromonospora sp. KC723 TaxID=2530381 RepID=UPI00104C10D5|nr:lysine biosynthesis protein LysX [Micromonospora sp. KC723]TDB78270.1 lysine biosynthesis protein LysX [Micromonospora sp. KC723]
MNGPIALLASRLRVEEKALLAAFSARGADVVHVDARRLRFPLAEPPPWRFVLNREISATRARYAAASLETQGIGTLNSSHAIATCGDKWLTSTALTAAGVPTPAAALALTPEAALDQIAVMGYPVVLKPLSSSWGRRVSLIRDADAAQAVLEHCAALPAPQAHLIYLQEFVNKPGRDIRVVVVGGRAVGAAYRNADTWRTNVARGATTTSCELHDGLADLAVRAAQAVGAAIAGVDVVEDADGRLLVLEVNSGVEFAGLQRALGDGCNVAGAIADLVLRDAPVPARVAA